MLRVFQRIRQFNNVELHPYPSQYNPCQKETVRLQVVGVMLFALPVGCVNIWPIGKVIPWGNHDAFFSILLTHEGSHREVYRDFQPSLTSSAGSANG